jgi:trans-aconitate 2-methyltransferase
VNTSSTTPTPDWNPQQYHRFAHERTQPFHDLLALVRRDQPIVRAVDLGCGSGELTALAADELGIGSLLGIDSSPSMLAEAAAHQRNGLQFEAGDIGEWTGVGALDLVLANASLQWVPDHVAVLRRWTATLAPGGQLAVQVPANAEQPSHTVATEVAARPHFAETFGPAGPPCDPVADNVLAPEQYARLLHELGFVEQHVRLQVYPHLLPQSRDVVEWVRGTTLTRFQKVMPADAYAQFLIEYEERLLEVIGQHQPYFFPFRRILFWGRLSG